MPYAYQKFMYQSRIESQRKNTKHFERDHNSSRPIEPLYKKEASLKINDPFNKETIQLSLLTTKFKSSQKFEVQILK